MKETIKNLPYVIKIYHLYRKIKKRIYYFFISFQGKEYIFTKYYKNNKWGNTQSRSGEGSTIENTQAIRDVIKSIIKKKNVRSILDAPCGDFNWMRLVISSEVSYIGVDIVEELINDNKDKYENDSIKFIKKDISNTDLPKVDLVICRDALVHMSNDTINKVLINFKNSGSKYLLATTFPDINQNRNIYNGMWRAINLCKEPYNLPEPIDSYDELDSLANENRKQLALWKIN